LHWGRRNDITTPIKWNHVLRDAEFINAAQSNLFNQGIIDEQFKKIIFARENGSHTKL
jgi:mannitol/fructose-specific phosphotransferase system IIA component (Ntr-type)